MKKYLVFQTKGFGIYSAVPRDTWEVVNREVICS